MQTTLNIVDDKKNNIKCNDSSVSIDNDDKKNDIKCNNNNNNNNVNDDRENDIKGNNNNDNDNNNNNNNNNDDNDNDTIITPWEVTSKKRFNYERLINEFGLEALDENVIKRMEKLTKQKVHTWIRRGIIFSHQGLNDILDHYEKGKPIYIYTGRGPSNQMHLGHLLPFILCKYLQDAFNAYVVIQMSDEEKYLFKENLNMEEIEEYLIDNIKDIIACGFDINKTFIFSNFDYSGQMHKLACKIMKIVNVNQLKKIYGFTDQDNIGKLQWPIQEICPAFPEAFPKIFFNENNDNNNLTSQDIMCLVPLAIDQTPYFRSARDIAAKLKFNKPAMICSKFLIGLSGEGDKMSSTGNNNDKTIYLSDNKKEITEKIMKYAVSGGQISQDLHRLHGGDPNKDVSFQYLLHFEENDELIAQYEEQYKKGKLLSSEMKKLLINKLIPYLNNHQQKKKLITQEIIQQFMNIKKFQYNNNNNNNNN